MPSIHLLPLGDVAPGLPARLADALESRFAAPVIVEEPAELRPEWLHAGSAQYRAGAVLDDLVAAPPADGGWSVALVAGDLSAPGLAFALGLSTLGGCCAVVGLARLDPAWDGKPADPEQLVRRAITEVVHEVGHLAGLPHCPDPRCVMHFSDDVAATDTKGSEFCTRCRATRQGAA